MVWHAHGFNRELSRAVRNITGPVRQAGGRLARRHCRWTIRRYPAGTDSPQFHEEKNARRWHFRHDAHGAYRGYNQRARLGLRLAVRRNPSRRGQARCPEFVSGGGSPGKGRGRYSSRRCRPGLRHRAFGSLLSMCCIGRVDAHPAGWHRRYSRPWVGLLPQRRSPSLWYHHDVSGSAALFAGDDHVTNPLFVCRRPSSSAVSDRTILILRENYKILLGFHQAEQENLRLAHHDLLTGLLNRVMKRKRLNELLSGPVLSTDRQAQFTVFCLDLDGFKEVNDRFGHAAGNAVLIAVARCLRESVRDEDFVCRVGGDEFVALLPALSADEAASCARRIIDKISKPYDIGFSTQPRLGISIGAACAPRDGVSANELLRSADRAMYEAKRRGKGVYVVHSAISEVVELAPSANADAG